MKSFFQYLSNEVKIRDRLIVLYIMVIKTPTFDCWCDRSRNEASWEDARCKRRGELFSDRWEKRIKVFHEA